MTKNRCSLLLLGHHGKYPPQFIPTHPAQTQHSDGLMMWDNDNVARTGTMTMTQHNDEAAPRHHDADAEQQCNDATPT